MRDIYRTEITLEDLEAIKCYNISSNALENLRKLFELHDKYVMDPAIRGQERDPSVQHP